MMYTKESRLTTTQSDEIIRPSTFKGGLQSEMDRSAV